MSEDHGFCRMLLAQARHQAQEDGVKLPKRITAITSAGRRDTNRQYFVETGTSPGEYIKACCAWHAKAKYICQLLAGAPTP